MFGISAFSETAFGSQPSSVNDVTVPIAGWGSSTWNTGAWGTNVTLPQASGAVGTATQQTNINQSVTGISATGAIGNTFETQNGAVGTTTVGTVTVETDSTANAVGVSATGAVGNTFETQNGAVGTTAVGSVVVPQHVDVDVIGIAAAGDVDDELVEIKVHITVNLTGVSSTGQVGNTFETQNGAVGTTAVGSPTIVQGQGIDVSVTGVSSTGTVHNEVAVIGDANITLTGVSTSSFVGSVIVWGNIIPVPGTSWSDVSVSTDNEWSDVTPNPDNTWTDVAA